jgi:glucose/arabinose dehydrogenase
MRLFCGHQRRKIKVVTREDLRMTYSTAKLALLAGVCMISFVANACAQQPAASPDSASPAATAPAPTPPPAAAPAAATPPALPPGSPLIGRPADSAAAARLAPVAAPPIAAAADKLPTARLKVPPGFTIEVYAAGMANARSIREGDKGTVFVGSRLVDKVYAIAKKDGKRQVKVIASGLYRPNGLAYKDGTLYIAELSKISKIENVEDNLDNPPKPTMIYDKLPKDEAHGWKFIAIGPDNKLYVPVGQPRQQRVA